MNILHLPTPVGGNAFGLSRGERQLNHQSDVLLQENNWQQFPADRTLFSTQSNSPIKKLMRIPQKLQTIKKLIDEYDVFHFNFGTSLIDHPNVYLPLFDLPMYKRRQKKIFVTYNGCDARQKYPTMKRVKYAACHDPTCYQGMCNSGKLDRERQLKIKKFNQFADGIFSLNPDLLYFLPERARFLPYTIARWHEIETRSYQVPQKTIQIMHAPTNRAAKGSEDIIQVVKEVQAQYPGRICLTLIENKTHAEALKIYQEADLIIDQIRIGWYGGFAVEALKMGKPVMVYLREEDLHFIPQQMQKDCLEAFINVNRETLLEQLVRIIEAPEQLKVFSEAGLEYIHTWHEPKEIAQQTVDAYQSVN